MGNRAVITTEEKKIGVYLHWNGGRDSVEAFLAVCKELDHRCPEDDCYGWARLCQVIANFIGGTTSIGIDTLDNLDCDNGENGVYIIKDWQIIGREHFDRREQQKYELQDMIAKVKDSQPQSTSRGNLAPQRGRGAAV